MHKEHAIFITLLGTKGLGTRTLHELQSVFSSWNALIIASRHEMSELHISQRVQTLIIRAQKTYQQTCADEILALYRKHSIEIILNTEDSYPPLLKEIPDAPLALFVRGDSAALTRGPFVTIVGSREHTQYGERATSALAYDLARAGVCIISGLARGIDTIAHRSSLDADGTTIGVLGGSVDDAHIAPRQNFHLAHALCDNSGAIMSEYPLFTRPSTYTFPARNRIMAGMSHITLVIESSEKSGTLITAHHAIEYNRDVCAVPGSIFSDMSVGTNILIRRGAKIVTCVQDILAELPQSSLSPLSITPAHQNIPDDLSTDEESVLKLLSTEALHVDKITAMSTLETTRVLSTLSLLEIKGLVRDVGGKCYIQGH